MKLAQRKGWKQQVVKEEPAERGAKTTQAQKNEHRRGKGRRTWPANGPRLKREGDAAAATTKKQR
jgi:hypothetical protein